MVTNNPRMFGGAMCTKKDIEDMLKQLQSCRDTEHMRRLLKEAIPCNECPEAIKTDGEQKHDCSCREHFRAEIKNIISSIHIKTE